MSIPEETREDRERRLIPAEYRHLKNCVLVIHKGKVIDILHPKKP